MQYQIYYGWMQFVIESSITARFYMLSPISKRSQKSKFSILNCSNVFIVS